MGRDRSETGITGRRKGEGNESKRQTSCRHNYSSASDSGVSEAGTDEVVGLLGKLARTQDVIVQFHGLAYDEL